MTAVIFFMTLRKSCPLVAYSQMERYTIGKIPLNSLRIAPFREGPQQYLYTWGDEGGWGGGNSCGEGRRGLTKEG